MFDFALAHQHFGTQRFTHRTYGKATTGHSPIDYTGQQRDEFDGLLASYQRRGLIESAPGPRGGTGWRLSERGVDYARALQRADAAAQRAQRAAHTQRKHA